MGSMFDVTKSAAELEQEIRHSEKVRRRKRVLAWLVVILALAGAGMGLFHLDNMIR